MKYGCVSSLCEIDAVSELGFDYLELHGKHVLALGEPEFATLAKKLNNSKAPCRALNLYCPPEIVIAGEHYDLDRAVAYATALSQRAATLGVENIGIGSPLSRTLPPHFPMDVARSQALDFFRATTEVFARHQIIVCIEALATCYCNFINTTGDAVEFAKQVNLETCKIVLDFYNMEHMGEADICLDEYAAWIAHAHASDDAGSPSKRYFFCSEKANTHTARMRELKRVGYDGKISLEVDLSVKAQDALASLATMKNAFE